MVVVHLCLIFILSALPTLVHLDMDDRDDDVMDFEECNDWLHTNLEYAHVPVERHLNTTNDKEAGINFVLQSFIYHQSFVYFNVDLSASHCELTGPDECNTPQVTHGAINLNTPVTCDKLGMVLAHTCLIFILSDLPYAHHYLNSKVMQSGQIPLTLINVEGKGKELEGHQCQRSREPYKSAPP